VSWQPADVALSVDRGIGEGIARAVVGRHRRRLRRCGWGHAFEADGKQWAQGEPSPRGGCSFEALVDGAEALPRIATALERATSHVHIAGWHFSPEFDLVRNGRPTVLRNLLGEVSTRCDVRVLAWAGAPLPLFKPSRGMVREMRDRLCDGTGIQCALDAKERPLHCHHEKTIVIDDEIAFVGGIDLTSQSGDRFDSSTHMARASVGWHDVCAAIRGPAVADVAQHFRMRWQEVTGERIDPPTSPPTAGDAELQVVRTVPERVYRALPDGDFRILESYLGALRGARRFIYLENQFLWSPEITAVLRQKLRDPPSDDFRLLIVLPAKPNTGSDDTRGTLAELVEADGEQGRLLACTLYARSGRAMDPIYVHAKVAVVDDEWLTVGSANLNDHSLFNDTEMNVVTHDKNIATRVRTRLWSEHLELPEADVDDAPARVIETRWKPVSSEQLDRLRAGEPLTHRLVRLPNVSRRTERLLGPLQGLLVDG